MRGHKASRRFVIAVGFITVAAFAACGGSDDSLVGDDDAGGTDAGGEKDSTSTPRDGGTDATTHPTDSGVDATTIVDAEAGIFDAAVDAELDAGTDAGVNGGEDAGVDSGTVVDAGFDAGFVCSGTSVCGDGTFGTVVGTKYACNSGVLGAATACAFGCGAATSTCNDLQPANQGATHLDPSGTADTFTCTGTQSASLPDAATASGETLAFNTTTKSVSRNGTSPISFTGTRWGNLYKPSVGGTNVIVAHIKSLSVSGGAKIVVTGNNALLLLVDQDVSLTGTYLDGSGHGIISAGVSTSGKGENGEGTGGGGGGGHGTVGAKGGIFGAKTPAAGGVAFSDAVVLEAGGSGGNGGGSAVSSAGAFGFGGIGGGGIQISACGSISVDATSLVNTSGAFGSGGAPNETATASSGGGAGGAGGTIIFEASMLQVTGKLISNGGGGGEGGEIPSTNGASGKPWDITGAASLAALGGSGKTTTGGSGGNGGVQGTIGVGSAATLATSGSGGGGGAVGRIFLNVPALSSAPTLTAGNVSPTAKTSKVCIVGATCSYTFDP